MIFTGGTALLHAPDWEDLLFPATWLGLPYPTAVLCFSVTNMGNMVRNVLLENKSKSRGVWTVPGSYLSWELDWRAIVIYTSSHKVVFYVNCSLLLC